MGRSHVICISQPWQLAAVHWCCAFVGESLQSRNVKAGSLRTQQRRRRRALSSTKHQSPGRAITITTTASTSVESGKMSLKYGVSGIGSTLAVVGACELVPAHLYCLRQRSKQVVRR